MLPTRGVRGMHVHTRMPREAKVIVEPSLTPTMWSVEVYRVAHKGHSSIGWMRRMAVVWSQGKRSCNHPWVQPGAGMFYQAQQAAMLQGRYRMPGMAQFPLGQGSMSAMPAGTGVNMATAGLGGAMCGPCGSVGAQSAFYPPNVPGGCGFGPPNVPGGCVFPSGQYGPSPPNVSGGRVFSSGQCGPSLLMCLEVVWATRAR